MNYRHTWTFSRKSRVLRFYLWAWKADAHSVTFCKLFWGLVFAVPNLTWRVIWILLKPVRIVCRKIHEADKAAEAKRKAEPKPDSEIPARIGEFFARPRVRTILKIIGLVIIVPVGLALLAGMAWAFLQAPTAAVLLAHWFLHTDAWKVAAIPVGWFLIVGAAWLLDRQFHFEERAKARKARKRAAGEPLLSEVLIEGAKAVKSNTCPRIEVRP